MPGLISPPRIAFFDQYANCGGGQKILISIIREAASKNWQTTAVLPARKELGTLVKKTSPGTLLCDIPELALRQGHKGLHDIGVLCRHIVRVLAKHGGLLRRQDIVYVNGPRLIPHALVLAMCSRARFCYHVHLDHTGPELHLLRLAARHPSTVGMILPSAFVQQRLQAFSSAFAAPRVSVLENGLGPEFDLPFEDRFSGAPLQSVVVIGRLSPEKGQDALLDAALAMPQTYFHLLGNNDFASPGFRQRLEHIMPANVRFHGRVNDVPTTVSKLNAQVCVVPSRCNEAFGLSAIEGMATSCITLVRDCGGLSEIAAKTGALTFVEDSDLTVSLLQLQNLPAHVLLEQARSQYDATIAHYRNSYFQNRIRTILTRILQQARTYI